MAGVRGWLSATLFAATLAGPAVAQGFASPPTPVQLFTDFCTRGASRLPASLAAPRQYTRLPDEARLTMGYGAPRVAQLAPPPRDAVPNPIYALGGREDEFLLLPAPNAKGDIASSCAVVWKGRQFADARAALFAITGMTPGDYDNSLLEGAHSFGVRGSGFELYTVELNGWTMLRMTPDQPAAEARGRHTPVSLNGSGLIEKQGRDGEVVVTTKPQ